MKAWSAPAMGNTSEGDLQSKAMELLDQYGPSDFVDAIQVSRFKQVFRKRFYTPLDRCDAFWEDVSANLKNSTHGLDKLKR